MRGGMNAAQLQNLYIKNRTAGSTNSAVPLWQLPETSWGAGGVILGRLPLGLMVAGSVEAGSVVSGPVEAGAVVAGSVVAGIVVAGGI